MNFIEHECLVRPGSVKSFCARHPYARARTHAPTLVRHAANGSTELRKSIVKTYRTLLSGSVLACVLLGGAANAGVLDPDCTPEKAAKGAAAKATVGVGGRCKPTETIKDTSKRAVGIDDDKHKDGKRLVEKGADKLKDD
jgi:hypothetical protein